MIRNVLIFLWFLPDKEKKEKEMIIAEKLEEEAKLYADERKIQHNRERLYDTIKFFDKIQQRKRDSKPRPIKWTGTYKDLSFNKTND